jgi:5-methylcytosine-specific restriction protein B
VSKDGEDEVRQVTYEVQDGIFKLMCASARTGERGGAAHGLDEATLAKANYYKVSLGQYNSPADDAIYAHCMANNVMAVGYGGSVDVSKAKDEVGIKEILKGAGFKEDGEGFRYTVSVLRTMHLDMKVGDIVFVSAGNSMVRAIGRVSGSYFMDENAPIRFKEFLKVDWLLKDVEIPVEDLYPKSLSMGTLYSLDRNLVKKDYFLKGLSTPEKKDGRYVLIIDEINRGNVASIFGELITLIEDDKREKGDEAAKLRLPYSKEDFSVPGNLYLLGTMNTADRSVEALDTALRRRFSFVEMPFKPELIKPTEVEGIDLPALVTTINERVEQLIDKDHHIGHSYFMGLNNAAELKRVFASKVIPLLEEYFHGDAKKVGAVLGEAFVESRKKTIAFAKGFDMDEYEVKELYTVKDPRAFTDLEPFKAIYTSA